MFNRHTRQNYDHQGKVIPKNNTGSFCTQKPKQPEFEVFKRDLKKRICNLSEENQAEVLAQFDDAIAKHGQQIKELLNQNDVQDSLAQSLAKFAGGLVEEKVTPASSTSMLSVPMLALSISSMGLASVLVNMISSLIMPVTSAATSSATSTATSSAIDWVAHSGAPSGGSDLCSDIILGCLQGYLTQGAQPWTLTDPQFSRVVNQANQQASSAAYLQLTKCITQDSMANTVIKAIKNSPNGTLQTATVTSGIWQGYQTSFQAMNIPGNAAPALQSAELALATSCQSLKKEALRAGEIAGAVIGSVAGLALLCLAGFYLKDKISDCINNCKNRSNNNIPRV